MLRCQFGWDDNTTRTFQTKDVDWLELRGDKNQPYDVPDLGEKAGLVKRLILEANGDVNGLEQFFAVPELDLESIPNNGVDLLQFTAVQVFRCEWHPVIAKKLFQLTSISLLDITGYSDIDCSSFGPLRNLRRVAFTQGKLRSVSGLQACDNVEALSLSYLRQFADIGSIHRLERLQDLAITNLPKLGGLLDISAFPNLRSLYVVDAPVTVDLESLTSRRSFEKLWIGVPTMGLDWHAVFSPAMLKVGLLETPQTPSDEEFRSIAKGRLKKLETISRAGPKHRRQVQLTFSS